MTIILTVIIAWLFTSLVAAFIIGAAIHMCDIRDRERVSRHEHSAR